MRAIVPILPLLLLAACQDEPDFDTRYDKAVEAIDARAKAMDADIAEAERAAATASDLPDESPSSNAAASSGE
ncbi:hypothetical protein [Sphingopyxis alaskensis]|jgi:hypothetical protein|uniref:hypothetical protein n=1 Tax=Sphingopyxis alaskensis TaxID=117207 RepID=UPI0002FE4362|nr:hypothetical protein [Sphingopyxis alaskensis]MCM3418693.1 hypothetical protein [Sphingopyxis alaskensis]